MREATLYNLSIFITYIIYMYVIVFMYFTFLCGYIILIFLKRNITNYKMVLFIQARSM